MHFYSSPLVTYDVAISKHEIVLLENMWRRNVRQTCVAHLYNVMHTVLPYDIVCIIARYASPAFASDARVNNVSYATKTVTYRLELNWN